jgi:hypothetical protein
VAALYAADLMFLIAKPTPSVRNAQRLLDRVRQLGAAGGACASCSPGLWAAPIPPKQIEGALGHPIHHVFPETTRPCRRRSIPACRWRWPETPTSPRSSIRFHPPDHRLARYRSAAPPSAPLGPPHRSLW